MSKQAHEVPSTMFAHDHASLVVAGGNDYELNRQLFGEAPALDLPFAEVGDPELRRKAVAPLAEVALAEVFDEPVQTVARETAAAPPKQRKRPHWGRRRPKKMPELLVSDGLVTEIIGEAVALRKSLEAEGMPTPAGAIIGGMPYGERRAHLLEAVLETVDTGVVPSPYGDTTSYQFYSLLPNYNRAGVQPVLYVAREVQEHPDTTALLKRLGLDPETTFAKDHDLGGVLEDLAAPAMERRRLTKLRADYLRVRDQLIHGGHIKGFTEAEVLAEISQISQDLPELDERLAHVEGVIDQRLAKEDAKIQAITERVMADRRYASAINMLPTYDGPGAEEIRRKSYTDNRKDIDGLSLSRPREERRWDEITANAALRCVAFFAGRNVASLSHITTVVGGDGKLLGRRMKELAQPAVSVEGRRDITTYGENPGDTPVGVLLPAVPAAEIIKADRITPARWGNGLFSFLEQRRLLIVDAGVASVTNPESRQRETRGNLDLASLVRAQNRRWGLRKAHVEATGPKRGVGQATGAIAALRTVIAAGETFREERALAAAQDPDTTAHDPHSPQHRSLVSA